MRFSPFIHIILFYTILLGIAIANGIVYAFFLFFRDLFAKKRAFFVFFRKIACKVPSLMIQ